MDNDIVPSGGPITGDEGWQDIMEKLYAELKPADLPEKVVRATEYLLAGWPRYKVARQLGVDTPTIRRWLSDYPTMAATLAHGQKLLSKWRMGKLEQQFQLAMERNEELLSMAFDGQYTDSEGTIRIGNPKILPVLAAQVRFMIGLAVGQKIDIHVTHEMGDSVFKAQKDALDYLAQQMSDKEEPIEVVYRVIDGERDTAGPVLNERGDPPFGKMCELDTNEEGTMCHICGKRYKGAGLGKHVTAAHGSSVDEYELLYMLDAGSVRALGEE